MVQLCGQAGLKCIGKTEMCHNLTFYVCDAIDHAILGEKTFLILVFLKE